MFLNASGVPGAVAAPAAPAALAAPAASGTPASVCSSTWAFHKTSPPPPTPILAMANLR